MLTAVDGQASVRSDLISKGSENNFSNLELRFDKSAGILQKFLAPDSTPYFSHEQLSDIRSVQGAISDGTRLDLPGYEADNVKFVVFGLKIRKIFSLGGDLQLFRDLSVIFHFIAHRANPIPVEPFHRRESGTAIARIGDHYRAT